MSLPLSLSLPNFRAAELLNFWLFPCLYSASQPPNFSTSAFLPILCAGTKSITPETDNEINLYIKISCHSQRSRRIYEFIDPATEFAMHEAAGRRVTAKRFSAANPQSIFQLIILISVFYRKISIRIWLKLNYFINFFAFFRPLSN